MHSFTNIASPVFSRADGSMIDAVVTIDGVDGSLPFTFSAAEYPDEWDALLDGVHGTIAAYVAPVAVEAARMTYKTDIWRRMSDAEADIFAAALDDAPSRLRGLWSDCITLEHSAPEFLSFKSQMVTAFGTARATAILAPSEG